jgi:hypothetical protein
VLVLVLIGVSTDGTEELIALDEGYRESGESRAGLLRTLRSAVLAPGPKRRGAAAMRAVDSCVRTSRRHTRLAC